MTSRRCRNLSDEGLRLYNVSINSTKNGHVLKRILHNLFWTKYDDKLLKISNNCRESSYTLFSYLDSNVKHVFNQGVRNIVKIILTPKVISKNILCNIKQNYLFHLDLAYKSHQSGDYNTVILCLLALQHQYVARLHISSKKIDRMFREMGDKYGTISNGFIHHFNHVIQNNYNELEIPSIFIYLLYCEGTHSNSPEKRQRLREIYELYYYFNIRKNFLSEIYRSKINDNELYSLSNNIKPFKIFQNETINPLINNYI